ncbi:MAG: sulfotransferase [Candidatus Hodarchaeota archaeon]
MYKYKNIIICGTYRSGTTIIAKCLNEHPNLLVTNELFTYDKQNNNTFYNKFKIMRKEYPYVGECIFNSTLKDKRKLFLDKVLTDKKLSKKEIIDILVKYSGKDVIYYADKLPDYTFHLRRLISIMKDVKIVFCVRDARAVIESQIRNYYHKQKYDNLSIEEIILHHGWCKKNIDDCINMKESWLTYMKEWEDIKRTHNITYLEIYYRDLVSNKTKEAIRIANFLKIDSKPLIQIFNQQFNPVNYNIWKNNIRNIDKKLPREWKKMLIKYGYGVKYG